MTTRWLARGETQLPVDDDWLSDGERRYAESKSFTKRRVEFLIARWTLKQAAVLALSLPDARTSLALIEARHGSDGAPALHVGGRPAPFDISMTDRAGWAVSVIAPPGSGVGVDLELVEPRSAAFVTDYFTPVEQSLVAAATDAGGDGAALAANLIWSAKESALKVLHTGLRADTRSVEVGIDDIAAPEGSWSALRVTSADGERFAGWWRRTGSFVLTTCARVPLAAPQSLEHPPALDAATPAHAWLEQPIALR
jgi:4'-phosphopantetheinyl transferase